MANPLNFLEYPNSMFLAVVEALKTETFPNPKVGAVLIDKNNKLKKLFLYDEDESIDVSMSSLETKHSGKKLTFLQQIFGNIGVGSVGRGTIIGSGKADN